MDIAKDLALIEALCVRAFPAGDSGYHAAWLGPGDWPDASDCYAYEAAVAERLTDRWGEPSRWGTVTLQERIARGEVIPEPWAVLAALAVDLRAWDIPGGDRRAVLAVADRNGEDQPRLRVFVTDIDPP